MKGLKEYLMFVLFCSIVLTLNYGCGCASVKEIYRETSPDQSYDVVVIERDCASLSSNEYQIYLVTKGGSTVNRDMVFESNHTSNIFLNAKWVNSRFLMISYGEANIRYFRNKWYPSGGDVVDDEVRIKLYEYEQPEGK